MRQPLKTFASSVFSGDGEDGILQEIFNRIGVKNRWCIDLGALNGIHDSNTRNLLLNDNWSGVLIEADRTYFEKVVELYKGNSKVICLNKFVSFEGTNTLDNLLATTPIPTNPDLLSIDIDGNDYYVWESMTHYQPRVVIIEFNQTIPNDIDFVQPRDMSVQQGSSLRALARLGSKKQYVLVSVVGTNAIFVHNDDFPKLDIDQPTLDELHSDTTYFTRLFQLYDGTLVLAGYNKLLWRNQVIDTEVLQVLSPSERVFKSGIRSSSVARAIVYWARRLPVYGFIQDLRKRKKHD